MTTFLALVVFCYVRGWLHVRMAFLHIVDLRHMTAFISGLVAIWVAAGTPLAIMDHELLSIHMVQHLLLMAVAPPLILLGAPIPGLLHGLPKRFIQDGLDPFLRSAPLRHLGRIIRYPAFCWFAGTLTVIGWHLSSLFAIGLHSVVCHEIEQASFLLAGLLFWWPVIQPWPSAYRGSEWSVPLYLFLATLPCDALSAFLTFCGRVIYPSYLSASHPHHISALQDQEWAGVFMWVSVTFIYMLPALLLTVRMLSPSISEAVTLGSKTFQISSLPPRRVGE
ncbi:MAG TPA: cytochrome c oxidase assembly protein [Candidatus Angelobacter sp.]